MKTTMVPKQPNPVFFAPQPAINALKKLFIDYLFIKNTFFLQNIDKKFILAKK